VLRYNVAGEQITSQGTRSFIESKCAVRVCLELLSRLSALMSMRKNVTDLLILLPVLLARLCFFLVTGNL
jgi:hypothetical protein